MRAFTQLAGTRYEVGGLGHASWPSYLVQISTGSANFISGGLGSFAFWIMAIPADNVKK